MLFLFTGSRRLCLSITERRRILVGDTFHAFKLHTNHLSANIIFAFHLKLKPDTQHIIPNANKVDHNEEEGE